MVFLLFAFIKNIYGSNILECMEYFWKDIQENVTASPQGREDKGKGDVLLFTISNDERE